MACLLVPLAMATAQLAALEGYVFREADGGPTRRPVTVELLEDGRAKYRSRTQPDGAFVFDKVREGRYAIRARFDDFVLAEDAVTVASGRNFAALMVPKRRAGGQPFGTVTVDQLASQGNRGLQRKLKQAAELAAKRDLAGAALLYEEAVEAGAQPEVWDALALLYLHMDRKEDAFRAFEKAIEMEPRFLLPYLHLGAVYLEERRFTELADVATRALDVDPRWVTGHLYLAEAQAARREFDAARKSAETASEIVRGRAAAPYLMLAKIGWARKDCAGARKYLDRFLELNTSARALPETAKSLQMLRACAPGS
ncbi:MAG: tetratricopeptide repeat protein [Bryobacteraceae bacterium]|nr:tetratricopeptide repeat protein [Bryobacteraceae bacterium]